MLPDLCFLPHETDDLAPAQPLCAPAAWRVKTRLMGGDYLARAVEFETDWRRVVARGQGRQGAPLLRLNIQNEAATDSLIAETLRGGLFERQLVFDAGGRLIGAPAQAYAVLHITSMGETFWMTSRQNEPFRFVWRGVHFKHCFDEKWRLNTSDAQIEVEIGQMLADDTCDCAFAWKWLHLNQRERDKITYRVARGSLDEVEMLLRAVGVSGAPNWQDAPWRLSVNVGTGAGTEFYAGGAAEIARGSCLQNDAETRALTPIQTRLIELVLCHFELWRDWRAQTYTVVRELWIEDDCRWEIPLRAPSMHEVVEARLLLRDWLRGQVAPDELAELMGES